jgi:hypothetical protein
MRNCIFYQYINTKMQFAGAATLPSRLERPMVPRWRGQGRSRWLIFNLSFPRAQNPASRSGSRRRDIAAMDARKALRPPPYRARCPARSREPPTPELVGRPAMFPGDQAVGTVSSNGLRQSANLSSSDPSRSATSRRQSRVTVLPFTRRAGIHAAARRPNSTPRTGSIS